MDDGRAQKIPNAGAGPKSSSSGGA
jgi:hypothetical protein